MLIAILTEYRRDRQTDRRIDRHNFQQHSPRSRLMALESSVGIVTIGIAKVGIMNF